MPLTPGSRFDVYEIGALVGAGGMGEVYRARDTRLNRDVAIKVLSGALAADPERLARFDREARLLASLNHPSIAQIYGFVDLRRRGRAPRGPGARARGRADARRPHRQGAHSGAEGDHAGAPDCLGARGGARRRYRPPRSQAGQRQGDRRGRREGPRLRPRQGASAAAGSRGPPDAHSPGLVLDDTGRRRAGHRRLHGARAGPRSGRGRALRPVGSGRRALRDADWAPSVRRRDHLRHDCRRPAGGRRFFGPAARHARRAAAADPALSRARSRLPPAARRRRAPRARRAGA